MVVRIHGQLEAVELEVGHPGFQLEEGVLQGPVGAPEGELDLGRSLLAGSPDRTLRAAPAKRRHLEFLALVVVLHLDDDGVDIALLFKSIKKEIEEGMASYLEIKGWQNGINVDRFDLVKRDYNLLYIIEFGSSIDEFKKKSIIRA